jgi:hypothetical protein
MEILGLLLNYEVLIAAMLVVVWALVICFIITVIDEWMYIRRVERKIMIHELKVSLQGTPFIRETGMAAERRAR